MSCRCGVVCLWAVVVVIMPTAVRAGGTDAQESPGRRRLRSRIPPLEFRVRARLTQPDRGSWRARHLAGEERQPRPGADALHPGCGEVAHSGAAGFSVAFGSARRPLGHRVIGQRPRQPRRQTPGSDLIPSYMPFGSAMPEAGATSSRVWHRPATGPTGSGGGRRPIG